MFQKSFTLGGGGGGGNISGVVYLPKDELEWMLWRILV